VILNVGWWPFEIMECRAIVVAIGGEADVAQGFDLVFALAGAPAAPHPGGPVRYRSCPTGCRATRRVRLYGYRRTTEQSLQRMYRSSS
jgi:hypothetical protein